MTLVVPKAAVSILSPQGLKVSAACGPVSLSGPRVVPLSDSWTEVEHFLCHGSFKSFSLAASEGRIAFPCVDNNLKVKRIAVVFDGTECPLFAGQLAARSRDALSIQPLPVSEMNAASLSNDLALIVVAVSTISLLDASALLERMLSICDVPILPVTPGGGGAWWVGPLLLGLDQELFVESRLALQSLASDVSGDSLSSPEIVKARGHQPVWAAFGAPGPTPAETTLLVELLEPLLKLGGLRMFGRVYIVSQRSSIDLRMPNRDDLYIDHDLASIGPLRLFQSHLWNLSAEDLKELPSGYACLTVKDAFSKELAEEMFHELLSPAEWISQELVVERFYYRRHSIAETPLLRFIKIFLSGKSVKLWMQERFAVSCRGRVSAAGTRYEFPDFAHMHTDWARDRTVAWVWHLARPWHSSWGGSLVWCPGGHVLYPSFNTLNLFRVSENSNHLVQPVHPLANGWRFAVNGWFHHLSEEKKESHKSISRVVAINSKTSVLTISLQ